MRAKSGHRALRVKPGLLVRRNVGEQVLIGDGIEVTVLAIEGGCADIHIHAPRNVRIDRAERRHAVRLQD